MEEIWIFQNMEMINYNLASSTDGDKYSWVSKETIICLSICPYLDVYWMII